MASSLILATLLGAATAQTTTLTLPFYGYDTMPIVASIVAAAPSATTLQLACSAGTDANDCGLFPFQTLVYGPSTYHMDMGVGDDDAFTMTQDCAVAESTALCRESAGGSEANDPGSSTATYEQSDVASLAVVVTGGAEMLGSARAEETGEVGVSVSTSRSAAASGSAASTATPSVTQIVGSNSASSSAGAASATPSTGAAARSVFFKGWGGLVGAFAGVLLL